jgi:hypothetical protein
MEQRAWRLVEMRRLLGVTQNCRLWAGGRRHARPALRCAEVGDLCTATCFYRLSADTNMRSRVAWGGFPKISADAAKPGRPAALRHRDRRAGHPLHPRPLAARERAAGHHSPTGGPARSSNC